MHTPRRRETGRPRAAQFAPRAVYIPGGSAHVVRKEGAQDGDSRSALTGAGRGWRGVPGADRAAPAGAAGALLPDARILRRTPRTPSRRRCWPPGKASAGSLRNAPRCAPGCTRSPPTGASTRAARPAGARPGSGTCLSSNRPCRPRATRPSGCSRFLTPSSRVPSTCRPGRRPATSRPKPSRWPS